MSSSSLHDALQHHLASWGLKQFESDEAYFQWQRERLTPSQLSQLHQHVEQKRRGSSSDEIAFYDATAHPRMLPVLHSQRYDYYRAVASRVVPGIADASTVLDFGCGAGILTTFYARQYPDTMFVGIDRSPASILRAQEQATALGVTNVRFTCLDVTEQPLSDSYDLILATHVLVQAEHDPGLPSRDWTTFERVRDPQQQAAFEARTGIGIRLDRLCEALSANGRMIVFEKTRQLARRVPFQRALAARGLRLIDRPVPVRYCLVEEVADDGPFYHLQRGTGGSLPWDEAPEPDEGLPVDPSAWQSLTPELGTPLYENHWPSAQSAWEQLGARQLTKHVTRQEADGRQLHVELGSASEGAYLYCANTFDQRQLVIVRKERRGEVEQYYEEIVAPSA